MDGRKVGFWIVLGLTLGFTGAAARAQEPVDNDDTKARLERLEKQNRELMETVKKLQGAASGVSTPTALPAGTQSLSENDVQKIVGDYLQTMQAPKDQPPSGLPGLGPQQYGPGYPSPIPKSPDPDRYRVGSDLRIQGAFNEYGYLWLYTPNKDFTMHIGSWVQADNVFWDQGNTLRANQVAGNAGRATNVGKVNQGVASGDQLGGMGDLQDGTYFRRVRPFVEGTMWEVGEYRLNLALENIQFSNTGFDEFWFGVNYLPVIGTVRIGHVKNAVGFEGDMSASSRCMTFMERSSYSEAIEQNLNFVTGLWLGNNFLDQRATYTATIYRPDPGQMSGAFFGDGQWGAQGRLTALPIWDGDGRTWMHLGLSGGWRNGSNNIAVSNFRTTALSARPELRDDNPPGSSGLPQALPNANSNRMIGTGPIACENDYMMGLEWAYILGPLSFQAEWGWNWMQNAIGVQPAGNVFNPAITPAQNYVFTGGYFQVAYTLTGESRNYDRKYGTLAREYFRGPLNNNFWFTRDEDGRLSFNTGAWEIAARYSYTDLNDGSGKNRIQGGIMNGCSIGLNWYLSTNLMCMFDYIYDVRRDLPTVTSGPVTPLNSTLPGFTQGFGMRVQLSF